MRSRLSRLLFAAVLSCALMATASSAAGANTAAVGSAAALRSADARAAALGGGCASGVNLDAPAPVQEGAMLCLVNEARERYGLTALAPSPALQESALDKARDLIRCNEFSHTACGREFTYWLNASGYMDADCWRVGENLAWGVAGEGTVNSLFRAWMRSPTHRENILGDFEETGIDLRVGDLGGLTGVHVWAQHFGSHCGS